MGKRVDRATLYEFVWSEPISTLAERFGRSDVCLSKLCKRHGIPLPARGHWARIQAGQKVRKPNLSAAENGQRDLVLELLSESERADRAKYREKEAALQRAIQALAFSTTRSAMHPLAKAARERLKCREAWSGRTLLRSAPKEVIDIEVTKGAIDRATSLASSILLCLEQTGAKIEIDRDRGKTTLELFRANIGLKISEHVARSDHEATPAERRAMDRYINGVNAGMYHADYPSIPRHDYTPTGRLTITASGWPQRNWRDTGRTQLEKRLGSIVAGIVSLAEEVRDREQERELKRMRHEADVRRYELEMQRRSQEQRKYRMLRLQTKQWIAANEIRAYLRFIETTSLQEPERKEDLAAWLKWASAKADWLDPSVLISDVILDAPELEKT